MSSRLLAGALLGLTLSTTAFAQSYTAPAGIPAVTAPGGVEGQAALPNLSHSRNVPTSAPALEDRVTTTGSVVRSRGGRMDRSR